LWKEWRDQRAPVVGFALLVPILLTIALVSVPGTWARADALPTFVAAGGLLIAALTIVSDLVPGELRRGRFDFLARMPGDLRQAFAAKLLFCVGALALFCLYGWICATVLSASLGGGKWFAPFEWTFSDRISTATGSHELRWSLLAPLIAFAAWTFAVSCWLPRGTLALPAASLVLALIGAPIAVVLLEHPEIPIHGQEIGLLSRWLPAAALLAAALSFLRGARHGRRPLRVVAWALVGPLVATAPVWAWTANRWIDYTRFDLASDVLYLRPVALGDGGRFLFANVCPQVRRFGGVIENEANHAVVIDLEDGTARAVGGVDSSFALPNGRAPIETTPFVFFLDADNEHGLRPLRSGLYAWDVTFDARLGRAADSRVQHDWMRQGGPIDLATRRSSARNSPSARTVPGLATLEEVAGAFADGRVLVVRRSDPHERRRRVELVVLDPSTDVRVPVAMPVGAAIPDGVSWSLGHLAFGAIVLGLQWHDDPGGPNYCVAPTRFVRVASDGTAQFTALLPGVEFGGVLGCPDESTLLLLRDGRRIVRAKFDGSPSEVVFPRESADRTTAESHAVGVPR
jgi:hypothetical protein